MAEAPDGAQQVLWQKSAAPVNPSRYGAHASCRREAFLPACAHQTRAAGARARRWQAPTSFFFRLNEMPEELKARLPPSDSRWRADVRAMEEGRYSTVCIGVILRCLSLHAKHLCFQAHEQPYHHQGCEPQL